MTRTSPLGRYDDAAPDTLHEVQLIGLPVRIMVASREHHDELLREFSLLALSGPSQRSDVPVRLVELTQILGVRYASSSARPEEEFERAIDAGTATLDLTYTVPAHVVEAADTLSALMAEADEFCRTEQLLTLERTPVLRDFAQWYLDEFRRQVAGEPPRPWTGPLEP